MKPITAEWVAKAEADLRMAQREVEATDAPNYDGVCFHAQQCAEKYLKACLVEADRAFPKSHDLGVLLELALDVAPGWETLRGELDSLTDRAVEVRYPGVTADADDAREAIEIAERLRASARARLGLAV